MTIYSTNGSQAIEQQLTAGLDVIVNYTSTEYENDPQPGVANCDTYTKIWAKNYEDFVEICEAHANGRKITFLKAN